MAKRLALPHRRDLPEIVLFHREHPAEPEIVLQVPNEFGTDSQTYVVNMESPTHRAWFDDLPNARELRDKLSLSQHAVYCPRTGYLREIEDLDEPTPTALLVAYARQGAYRATPVFDKFLAAKKRRSRVVDRVASMVSVPQSWVRRLVGGRA